jgi:hypothetical protein
MRATMQSRKCCGLNLKSLGEPKRRAMREKGEAKIDKRSCAIRQPSDKWDTNPLPFLVHRMKSGASVPALFVALFVLVVSVGPSTIAYP